MDPASVKFCPYILLGLSRRMSAGSEGSRSLSSGASRAVLVAKSDQAEVL